MRCVLYLRMSTDDQENSITEQRAALAEYAAKCGHQIVGEYVDEGISGDATEKRLAFQKMIADCRDRRFEIVLAWDQDRFGRFDPLEAGYWIKPMRDAGVMLETIAQGRVDWNDFAGRIVWSVTQESKHAFLRDLAGNCLRGNIARAKNGISTGRIPFGYTRDESGKYQLGDAESVATIQRIFEMRLQGLGYWLIACRLNEQKRPTASGSGTWSKEAVRGVVMRETYTGTLVFGHYHSGKYKTMKDGVVAPSVGRSKNLAPVRVEDAHPAIIPVQQWLAAQEMCQKAKPYSNQGRQGAPLAGLLYCSLCNAPMYSISPRRDGDRVIAAATYRCSTYHTGQGCHHCYVRQAEIHEQVAERIRDTILGDCTTVEQLTESLKAHAATECRPDAAPLRQRLTALDKQIAEAGQRILTVDQRLVPSLEARLIEMHDRREALAVEIEAIATAPVVSPQVAAEELWKLARLFECGNATVVRQALRLMFSRIDLAFAPIGENGRGRQFRCTGFTLIDRVSSKEWGSGRRDTPFCMSLASSLIRLRDQAEPRTTRS